MEELPVKTIICKDCGQAFYLSAPHARWFKEHNLEEPKRCPDCIKRRRKDVEKGKSA